MKNLRNGHGYEIILDETELASQAMHFPEFASQSLETLLTSNSLLVEGSPGSGKSHLAYDIARLACNEGIPALIFHAHINGGSTKGVEHGLRVIDGFVSEFGPDALISVDNLDYYGYSGARQTRRRTVAQKHLAVAALLQEVATDSANSPFLCGLAHNQEWRDNHWLYTSHENNPINQSAGSLLDSFAEILHFNGLVSEEVARQMLQNKFGQVMDDSEIDRVIEEIRNYSGGEVSFRYLKHASFSIFENPHQELRDIDGGTIHRIIGGAVKYRRVYA